MLLLNINGLILKIRVRQTKIIRNKKFPFPISQLIYHILELLEIWDVLILLQVG